MQVHGRYSSGAYNDQNDTNDRQPYDTGISFSTKLPWKHTKVLLLQSYQRPGTRYTLSTQNEKQFSLAPFLPIYFLMIWTPRTLLHTPSHTHALSRASTLTYIQHAIQTMSTSYVRTIFRKNNLTYVHPSHPGMWLSICRLARLNLTSTSLSVAATLIDIPSSDPSTISPLSPSTTDSRTALQNTCNSVSDTSG